MIREREDIKQEVYENPKLLEKYREWDEEQQNSLANVEVQKIGYSFPGQRSACYSSDLLLRQYKRVKGEKKKAFSYKDIKSVYTIVFFETSIKEFHEYPQNYIHKFKQQSDTGLELEYSL